MATTTAAETHNAAAIDAVPNGGVQLRHIPLSRVVVLSRDHAEGGFRGGSENGQHAGWLRSGSSPDKRVRAERGAARRAERVAACAPLAGAGCSHVRKGGTA